MDADPNTPVLKLATNSTDQPEGQPAGVRILAKMDMVGGAASLALAGALTVALTWIASVSQVSGAAMASLIAVNTIFYCLAALLFIGRHGLLAGKPWARRLARYQAVAYIGIAAALLIYMATARSIWLFPRISIGVVAVGLAVGIAGVAVLLYLNKPNVILYFDGTYQNPGRGLGWEAWLRRLYRGISEEIRTEFDEKMLEGCNAPGLNALNGLRTALDKIQ